MDVARAVTRISDDAVSRRKYGSFLNNIKSAYNSVIAEHNRAIAELRADMSKIISNRDVTIVGLRVDAQHWREQLTEKQRIIHSQNLTIRQYRKRVELDPFQGNRALTILERYFKRRQRTAREPTVFFWSWCDNSVFGLNQY
ncbi:hypothetical protein BDD12DRAFT_823722 [Trichophaea hybrida]|nr:hypothetical protein BDD12DRAFT_823722 [Trichophaea hybrida]